MAHSQITGYEILDNEDKSLKDLKVFWIAIYSPTTLFLIGPGLFRNKLISGTDGEWTFEGCPSGSYQTWAMCFHGDQQDQINVTI